MKVGVNTSIRATLYVTTVVGVNKRCFEVVFLSSPVAAGNSNAN